MEGSDDGRDFDPDEILAEIDAGEYLTREEQLARLSPDGHAAATWIVESNLAAVVASLAQAELDGPACALCLMATEDQEIEEEERRLGVELGAILSIGDVFVTTPSWRGRAVAKDSFGDVMISAWLGQEFPHSFSVDPNLRTPDFRQIERQLGREASDLAGYPPIGGDHSETSDWSEWPTGWIFERVARRLNERPPLGSVTDDFVAYYQDTDFGPDTSILVPRVARPEAVHRLREQGLLRHPEDPDLLKT